jgi:hypothetical protein
MSARMARDPGRAGCAAESRDRSEPLLGTASRVRRWLLVEQRGAWGRDALHESRFPRHLADHLEALALAHRTRVVLIRRSVTPDDHEGPRAAFLVRSDGATRWAERVEFDDPVDLLTVRLGSLASDEPPGIGAPVDGSLHLVCTNGRHDPCCADFGRPVVRSLRAAGVEAAECSHIGGDRFAANVVCLPTGVYFGRVPPEEAARIIADHDAGTLDLDHYRGRSHLPPMVQAAEVLARRELDERRLDALAFRSWEHDAAGATVVLDLDGGAVEIGVSRRRGKPEQLTCADPRSPAWEYSLGSLTVTR